MSLVRDAEGKAHHFISQIQDVTTKKQAEEKFRIIFDNPSVPHLLMNGQRQVVDCNHSTLRLMNTTDKARFLATPLSHFSPAFQSDGQSSAEMAEEIYALVNATGYHRFNWLYRRSTGDEFPMEVTMNSVELQGESRFLVTWRDLTEVRRADQEREILIQKLVDSNSELERFAFIATHDLQEPLRLISNFTGLLQKTTTGSLDDESIQYLSIIAQSAKRMHALILDLLEYSRVSFEPTGDEVIDTNKCIEYVCDILQIVIKETGARVTWSTLPTLKGSSVYFSTLLQNLIGNALKYKSKTGLPP